MDRCDPHVSTSSLSLLQVRAMHIDSGARCPQLLILVPLREGSVCLPPSAVATLLQLLLMTAAWPQPPPPSSPSSPPTPSPDDGIILRCQGPHTALAQYEVHCCGLSLNATRDGHLKQLTCTQQPHTQPHTQVPSSLPWCIDLCLCWHPVISSISYGDFY